MSKISSMVSMELSDDEKIDYPQPISLGNLPDYPYGLMISLSEKEMDRLGIDASEAQVGRTFTFQAKARIKCVSAHEAEDTSSFRLEAQIEEMFVESEGD